MNLANNKFKTLKRKSLWEAPSAEEEKILALEAEVKKLKKASKRTPSEHKTSDKNPSKEKEKKTNKNKGKKIKKPDWFSQKPKTSEMGKSKTWNNRQWWWCGPDTGGKCAGVWRVHKPAGCEGKAHTFNKEGSDANPGSEKKRGPAVRENQKRKLELAKTMEALVDEDNDYE
jgi:hypothetical protein